jgi:hypothetical protein
MKYDEIANELYGVNYDSVNLTKLQQARIRVVYDERNGHINVRHRKQLNSALIA